ncbi:MFS transporter [Stackebrandtia endophytica]|nr:MFS transporter [Stackebrandtia endophytica]
MTRPTEPDRRRMRRFRLLALANAVTAFGSNLNMVALGLFAYQTTGSPLQTGAFMALRLGTGFVTGLFAGNTVSRIPYKTVIVGANLVQATAMLLLLMVPATGVALYVVAVLTGVAGTMAAVALRSAVPSIVGQENRVQANSLLVAGRSIALIAGFAASGIIIAGLDYLGVFAINIAAFCLAGLIVMFLNLGANQAPATERRWLASQATALRYIRDRPVVGGLIAIRTIIGIASATAGVAIPIYSSALDPQRPEAFMGQFWTVWAVGNIAMQIGVSRWARRTGRSVGTDVFIAAACVMSLASIVVFTGWALVLTLVAAAVTGAASGLAETAYQSRLQEAPDEQRGHLFGLSLTSENLGFAAGMLAAGTLLVALSPLVVVATVAVVAIVAAVGFRLSNRALSREPDRVEQPS